MKNYYLKKKERKRKYKDNTEQGSPEIAKDLIFEIRTKSAMVVMVY